MHLGIYLVQPRSTRAPAVLQATAHAAEALGYPATPDDAARGFIDTRNERWAETMLARIDQVADELGLPALR